MIDARCIWCLGPADGDHKEHIIPEVIGCPEGFVLPSTVVCRKCNNGLAHLDQAVADEFDFLAFMAGVPRKKGRPPVIKSRGNVVASVEPTGPTFTFNMERYPVTAHDGSTIAPFRGSQRNIRAKLSKYGHVGTVSFDLAFGDNPKFIRGLTKIAFSSLAYFLGAPLARESSFNAIRSFVLAGCGKRHVLLSEAKDTEYRNSAWSPYVSKRGGYAATFRIARFEFLVDLTEAEADLPNFEAWARDHYGGVGWCTLPPRG